MAKPVLYYWPLRGRAEVARLAMSYAGQDWEEVKADPAEMKSNLDKYPFAQSPVFVDGDLVIAQSNTILRYLARKHNLDGKTEADKVVVDMCMEGVESLRSKYVPLIYQDKLSDEGKATFLSSHIAPEGASRSNGGAHLTYLARFVKNGKDGYITGSGLTIGDLAVWEIVDLLLRIFPEEVKSMHPELAAFHSRIAQIPAISAYLEGPRRAPNPNNSPLG